MCVVLVLATPPLPKAPLKTDLEKDVRSQTQETVNIPRCTRFGSIFISHPTHYVFRINLEKEKGETIRRAEAF